MNAKDYSALSKQFTIDQELEETERVISSFLRVEKGESFTLDDLEIVRKTLAERKNDSNASINIRSVINDLEVDVHLTKERSTVHKRKLKRRGIDLDRLRRQLRLQHERKRQYDLEQRR